MLSNAAAPLRAYTMAKQRVAECIRAAQQALQASDRGEAAERCQALLIDLAEDRFNLAVVGQFKRGKSSLMNAIVGREVLPTGLLPLTSAITSLCYGPQEKLILRRQGWSLPQEIAVADLADYVTEHGNPGNVKGVLEARLELPVNFLRRGLHFVDTPGIGSFRQENTATTYAFLPQADAVIFVTSVEAPLSEAEVAFLQDIRQYVSKVFFVANKIDLLTPEERRTVSDYIQSGLERITGNGQIRLFAVSAQEALKAQRSSGEGWAKSGLAELQDALAAFLAEEKERIFLRAVLDRLLRLVAEVADSERVDADLSAARAAALALRTELRAGQDAALVTTDRVLGGGETPVASALPDTDAAAQPFRRRVVLGGACPICQAMVQAGQEYFIDLQVSLAHSGAARADFGRSGGLCAVHHWQFQPLAAPQAVSDAYAVLVDSALAAVSAALAKPGATERGLPVAFGPGHDGCPVCRLLRQVQGDQVAILVAALARPEEQERYRQVAGLCMPHLQQALAPPCPTDIAEYLLTEQRRRLEALSEDLRSYSLKRAALRRGLINQDEETAWRRALVQLAGERNAHLSAS
jgi:GTP-binding protein EngB required for normal cell division